MPNTNDISVILAFHSLGFNEKFLRFLINNYTLEEIWKVWEIFSYLKLKEVFILKQDLEGVWRSRDLGLPLKVLNELKSKGIDFVILGSDHYPKLLSKISDPPPILYYRGSLEALKARRFVAFVGSRKMTSYGKRCIEHLVPGVVQSGVGIVSGLALGVDAYCHEIAMKSGGKPVAVLGCGLDHIYPPSNRWMYRKVLESGGILLSPFVPCEEPFKHNFPLRNRVISGLSDGVLIVEAAPRSGSLITGDLALEQGRSVMTVPGSIFSELSRGANSLWKSGAVPVWDSKEILESLGFDVSKTIVVNREIENDLHKKVWEMLIEPRVFDDLIMELDMDSISLQVLLSEMEIEGLILKSEHGWERR